MLITTTGYSKTFNFYLPQDTIKKSVPQNSFLNSKVSYDAKDSMIVDMTHQKAFLYNKAEVFYEDIKLHAGYIEIDFIKNIVVATSIKDSAGKDSQLPVFEQGQDKFTAGIIKYNFTTKKGKITDVITQQNDGYIHGRDIKKDTDNTYYVAHGKYTTCDLEHPHYYIGAKNIKVIPNDKIITGPACLYVMDIPTPLCLPFGFFPNKIGRKSGVLIPTYGESNSLGFFLKNGGFYYGGSDKVDLQLLADIYSNGSFGARAISNYRKRYHYGGGLSISYARIIEGDAVLPTTQTKNDFFVKWSHTQDQKSHPYSRFSADLNAGTSSYNKYNGSPTGDYLNNNFSSNIQYSKAFPGTPFNFSAALRHSQNSQKKTIEASIPEVALSMNRIFPFKKRNSISNKWFDKIGLSASVNAQNKIAAYDSTLFTHQTIRSMQNGIHVAVPISTSFNVLKYFTFTPTISVGSSVYFETIHKRYDENVNYTFADTTHEVRTANDFSVSGGLTTRLYGDYFFKTKHLKQIRHVATPTISASYRPDFSESQYGYYQNVENDYSHSLPQYAIFPSSTYAPPSPGRSALIGFALNNNLEAKTKTQSDSGAVFNKVSLIDNFGLGFSYNAAVHNFNWSNIALNARTVLFKKLNITAAASLDPYQLDSLGNKIEKFEWNNGRIGRLTNATASAGFDIKSKEHATAKPSANVANQDELDYIYSHPDAYVDFNVPYNLRVQYNINYSHTPTISQITQSITFFGDLSITKKWKISATSGYDFVTNKLTLTSLNIYRDLHCWEMRFNWIPFGPRQMYSIDIKVKSSVLQDLKLSKRKDWYDYN